MVFVCEDCGDRVHIVDWQGEPPALCGPCDWVRTMPEAERPELRRRLRLYTDPLAEPDK